MLSKADPQNINLSATEHKSRGLVGLINRKIWLPRVVYDGLPWFYLAAGVAAFLATLYISAWFWILPHYLLFAAGCVHLGVFIIRRRRPSEVESTDPPPDT